MHVEHPHLLGAFEATRHQVKTGKRLPTFSWCVCETFFIITTFPESSAVTTEILETVNFAPSFQSNIGILIIKYGAFLLRL